MAADLRGAFFVDAGRDRAALAEMAAAMIDYLLIAAFALAVLGLFAELWRV